MILRSRFFAVPVLCAAFTASALAAPPDSKADAKAAQDAKEMREHFKLGNTHYSLGEFAEAAAEFREAYRLKPEPAILFNIGQAMRQMNDYRHAYFYYAQYLTQRPDAVNRSEVEQFMSAMKQKMDQEEGLKAAQAGPPALPSLSFEPDKPAATTVTATPVTGATSANGAAPAAAVSAPPQVAVVSAAAPPSDSTFWTGTHIGGVVAAGAAVVVGGVALAAHAGAVSDANTLNQKYQSGTLTTQDASLKDSVNSKGKLATAGAVAAGVLVVAAAALIFAF